MGVYVALPRSCRGSEIIAAFERAASFLMSELERWEPFRFHRGVHAMAVEGLLVAHEGVHATPLYRHRRGWLARKLFGGDEFVWRTVSGEDIARFRTQVTLEPLDPDREYDRVLVTVVHCHDDDLYMMYCRVAQSPDDPGFAPIRPYFDHIIGTLIATLQPS